MSTILRRIDCLNYKKIKTAEAPSAIGPYSQGVVIGDLLFSSGQIAINPKNNEMIKGGIKAQTRRAIQNLKAVISSAGGKIENTIKTTVYLKKMEDFQSMNEVYAKFFKNKPARSTVEVKRLPKNALIEIESIVYLNHGDRKN
jgi:2-iminobutanoate/2-iminopropanoate deaminase